MGLASHFYFPRHHTVDQRHFVLFELLYFGLHEGDARGHRFPAYRQTGIPLSSTKPHLEKGGFFVGLAQFVERPECIREVISRPDSLLYNCPVFWEGINLGKARVSLYRINTSIILICKYF